MNDFVGFLISVSSDIWQEHENYVSILGVAIIIFLIVFIARKGLIGRGFWGKNRTKIAEYSFDLKYGKRKIFVYKLEDKNGYQGYGLEFTRTKEKSYLGARGMKMSFSAVEFTKDEADKLVELVSQDKRGQTKPPPV